MVRQCVFLVGGLGTRLGNLAKDRPKPLIEIGDRPFLDTLVREAARRGFSKLLFLAGHRAPQVADFVTELRRSGGFSGEIDLSVEPEPLGTAGALALAKAKLDDEFLLLNGDSWFDFNWLDLALALQSQPAATMALGLRHETEVSRYGIVELEGKRVTGFRERGSLGGGLINGGVYACRRSLVDVLPTCGSLEADVLPKLAAEGRLAGVVYDGFFIDIGVPAALAAAPGAIAAAKTRPAAFLDRDGVINVDKQYVHRPEDLEFIPGAVEGVKWLNDRGFYVFVITNQAGVARGLYSEDDVQSFHVHLAGELRTAGAAIDDFRYCPFHPDGTIERYRKNSAWRKPEPGMILDLFERWPINRARSFLVGNKKSDVQAATAAGIRGYIFVGGSLIDRIIAVVGSSQN